MATSFLLSHPAMIFIQISLIGRQGCLRHIISNAKGLDCIRLICEGFIRGLRSSAMAVKTGILQMEGRGTDLVMTPQHL